MKKKSVKKKTTTISKLNTLNLNSAIIIFIILAFVLIIIFSFYYLGQPKLSSTISQSETPLQSPPTSGLVLHLPLNGNANDVSGNNLHGRIFGDTSAVGGKIGQAYKFDGNDDAIVVNHSTQFNSISNA
ncbi:MAG: hypothetical protein QW727_03730, partial [Candidatus Pacearchaeota archaeon]